jgi:hypothetical protein
MPRPSCVALSETFCSYTGYPPIALLVFSLLPTAKQLPHAHQRVPTLREPPSDSNPPLSTMVIAAYEHDRVNRTTARACVAIPPMHLPKPYRESGPRMSAR